ncbi:MAG: hypothetical protein JWL80_318 [Parcubacteria group bacterium]|nr:hypothetical protein [Parcubacteria group bacterium]
MFNLSIDHGSHAKIALWSVAFVVTSLLSGAAIPKPTGFVCGEVVSRESIQPGVPWQEKILFKNNDTLRVWTNIPIQIEYKEREPGGKIYKIFYVDRVLASGESRRYFWNILQVNNCGGPAYRHT